ncbi:MAG: hypothetical protein O3B13_08795 [Planctomycetota bacterium]|nr:hypothetical protein [Planctomycetota bacterium]MDA1163185.1 hypothetical protein [Planctomycetota bacterium]
MMKQFVRVRSDRQRRRRGTIFVEYILLITLVGIGAIVGLACVRSALINELLDLANAINAINA